MLLLIIYHLYTITTKTMLLYLFTTSRPNDYYIYNIFDILPILNTHDDY